MNQPKNRKNNIVLLIIFIALITTAKTTIKDFKVTN